jgi:branched-chain amino acid transport system substrate-binding protein
MKKSFILLIVVCLVFGFFSNISLAKSGDNPEVFKLGILLPFTGTFAAVAKTQKEGALQAVKEVNDKGGLSMPWDKVKVETIIADDEAKIDVGLRRFKYMLAEGVNAVEGQTWNPLAFAINEVAKKSAIPYFPTCVASYDSFKKGVLAECTFAVAFQPWTLGAMAADVAVNTLKGKTIYYLSRSDSWGDGIYDGLKSYLSNTDAEIIGYDSVPKGTSKFTAILQKVKAAKPDVFIFAQFGGDCAAVLKQAYELGLKKDTILLNTWMTNAVATGIPQEALEGVYANAYFYWDLTGFPDKAVAKSVADFSKRYEENWGEPPDAYGVIAYDATKALFEAVEKAESFEPEKIAKAIMYSPKFTTAKGLAYWRKDHQPVFQYAGFALKGKSPADRKGDWDFFDVIGSAGGEEVLPPLKDLGY